MPKVYNDSFLPFAEFMTGIRVLKAFSKHNGLPSCLPGKIRDYIREHQNAVRIRRKLSLPFMKLNWERPKILFFAICHEYLGCWKVCAHFGQQSSLRTKNCSKSDIVKTSVKSQKRTKLPLQYH